MVKKIISKSTFLVKVSRPGLWFATIWLYVLPTSSDYFILQTASFWIGFFYVCFPLNLMVYGWNDIVDYETDKLNPRKDSFWFGAKASKEQLKHLWKPILITQLVYLPLLIYFSDFRILGIVFCFLIINYLYNKPVNGLRSKPPFELLCQIGYLLIVPLSIFLNHTQNLSWAAYAYLFMFSVQSHLIGEVMDYMPDKKSNRKTTATVIGIYRTKLLIILLVFFEILILTYYFEAKYLALVLMAGFVWLLIDLFVIYKAQNYNLKEMKLFAIGSNLLGAFTIIYVWWTACLN